MVVVRGGWCPHVFSCLPAGQAFEVHQRKRIRRHGGLLPCPQPIQPCQDIPPVPSQPPPLDLKLHLRELRMN